MREEYIVMKSFFTENPRRNFSDGIQKTERWTSWDAENKLVTWLLLAVMSIPLYYVINL